MGVEHVNEPFLLTIMLHPESVADNCQHDIENKEPCSLIELTIEVEIDRGAVNDNPIKPVFKNFAWPPYRSLAQMPRS